MITAVDALGRALRLAGPARRVVSLVPSETESVAALGGLGVLVGRSDYCTEPRGSIERIPSCGGTKSIDVARVAALAPDLILVNQEENAKKEVERLIAAGLPVHVSFPHDVRESLAYVETLARLLGVEAVGVEGALGATREAVRRALERGALRRSVPLRVFVPIWMDPLMTFDGRTFASDLLELAGAVNVFGNRPRRYPLAADLGTAPALPAEQIAGRDTRYPRVTIDEVVAQSPDLVLLHSASVSAPAVCCRRTCRRPPGRPC